MSESLREKAGTALFWSFIDKGGQQLIQLAFGCVLVRLLSPKEFGLIGVLFIFTVIANILQESGFSSALIRKKDADESDYSTVFYFNISISIAIYLILFAVSPLIASFYKAPILTNLSRVIFLSFIFNSFGLIQNVHLVKKMDFKTNTKISFIAGILSGGIAIAMAYAGYGVWSLAIQQVLQAFLRSLFLWLFIKWYPHTSFAMDRLKAMTSYSFKLLLNAVFNQVASNLYTIVIGKFYSLAQVGFYTQAYKLNYIPQTVVSGSLQSVSYPLLTKIEDDDLRRKRAFRKIVRIISFVSFPIAMLLIVTAKPLVIILLTDKWLPTVPILQILAIGGSIFPFYGLLNSLLQSLGKSGLLLSIESTRNVLSILFIILTIKFGVLGLVSGMSFVNIVVFIGAFHIAGKHIAYRLKEAAKDILPYLVVAFCIFAPLYFLERAISNHFVLLLTQTIVGGAAYLGLLKWFGSKVIDDCLEFLKKKGK